VQPLVLGVSHLFRSYIIKEIYVNILSSSFRPSAVGTFLGHRYNSRSKIITIVEFFKGLKSKLDYIITTIKSRKTGLTGHAARMGQMISLYHKVLVESPDGIRPLARPRKRREAHVITDLK
jgi:hypothetical protein